MTKNARRLEEKKQKRIRQYELEQQAEQKADPEKFGALRTAYS